MPDVAMCSHKACPSRSNCYRHADSGTRPTERRQSYMQFHPLPGQPCCGDYIPNDRHRESFQTIETENGQ